MIKCVCVHKYMHTDTYIKKWYQLEGTLCVLQWCLRYVGWPPILVILPTSMFAGRRPCRFFVLHLSMWRVVPFHFDFWYWTWILMLIICWYGPCFKGSPFLGKHLHWLQEQQDSVLNEQYSSAGQAISRVSFLFFPHIFPVFPNSAVIQKFD